MSTSIKKDGSATLKDGSRFPKEAYDYTTDVTREAVSLVAEKVSPYLEDLELEHTDGFGRVLKIQD